MALSPHARGVLLMLCTGLLWSIAGVFTRHLDAAPPWEVTFWRSLFCAVAMVALIPVSRRRSPLAAVVALGPVGWLSGALWAVMFTCFMLALTQTTTANTLILTAISPLTASLFAWLLLGERVAGRTWGLVALALAGIAVMFGAELDAGGNRMAGNLIALLVPLAAGLNFTLMRRSGTHVDLAPAVLVGALLSAVATLPLALPCQASGHDLAILALLGACQLAIPCTLAVAAARYLTATEVALLGLSENVFGPLWAWLGAGEAPGGHALAGGSLVLAALVGEALGRSRRAPLRATPGPDDAPAGRR